MSWSVIAITWFSKPTKEISNSASSFSNESEKFPSKSVLVPFPVPTSIIDAPVSGRPSLSKIDPDMVLCISYSSAYCETLTLDLILKSFLTITVLFSESS